MFFPKKTNNRKNTSYLQLGIFIILLSLTLIAKNQIYRSFYTVNLGGLYVDFLNFKAELNYLFNSKSINKVNISMSPNNYVKLQNERTKMVSNYIITGDHWLRENNYFKVKYTEDSLKSKGEIKLFGMNPDHYRDNNGHSFRIRFDGGTGFGSKKLNFINPRSRDFITDVYSNQLYNKLTKGLKINHRVVKVDVNKIDYGFFIEEDFFDKYLIEKNNYRDSPIFEIIKDSIHFNHIGDEDEFLSKSLELTDLYNNQYEKFIELIDVEKVKALLFVSLIINDYHPLLEINLHWYFNPVTGLIEPSIREGFVYNIEEVNFDNLILPGVLKDIYKKKIQNSLENYIVENIETAENIFVNKEYQRFRNDLIGFKNNVLEKENIIKNNLNILSKSFKEYNDLVLEDFDEFKLIEFKRDTILSNNLTIHKNEKLVIHEGVHLTLKDVYLKVYGELNILGSKERKVEIFGDPKTHNTIFINSRKPVIIKYTNFKNLSNLRSPFDQPAAITFYETDGIEIINSIFKNNISGDDFINFFRSKNVIFNNSEIYNSNSDAIDSDFSEVYIKNSTFKNIGNDAVDGSGSNIKIENSLFENVNDKAISAGENSFFESLNNIFKSNEIALVAKDDSELTSENDKLENNKLDLALFKKKKIFKRPKFKSQSNISSYLIEKKCKVEGLTNLIYTSNVEEKLYGNLYGAASK